MSTFPDRQKIKQTNRKLKYVHVQTFVDLAGKGGGKHITKQRLEKLCLPGSSIQTEKIKTKFFLI